MSKFDILAHCVFESDRPALMYDWHTVRHEKSLLSFSEWENNFDEFLSGILTYVNFQNFISGSISEKRLASCAADFIGPAVGEHGAHSLILPWSVNGPVSVDDGSSWAASESLEGTTAELCIVPAHSKKKTKQTIKPIRQCENVKNSDISNKIGHPNRGFVLMRLKISQRWQNRSRKSQNLPRRFPLIPWTKYKSPLEKH